MWNTVQGLDIPRWILESPNSRYSQAQGINDDDNYDNVIDTILTVKQHPNECTHELVLFFQQRYGIT